MKLAFLFVLWIVAITSVCMADGIPPGWGFIALALVTFIIWVQVTE